MPKRVFLVHPTPLALPPVDEAFKTLWPQAQIVNLLDDDELRQLSVVMSTLGTIDSEAVESLLLEFVGRMSASGALMGNYDATERLLHQFLPPERVGGIMDEIRGPAGRNMWEKLSNVTT